MRARGLRILTIALAIVAGGCDEQSSSKPVAVAIDAAVMTPPPPPTASMIPVVTTPPPSEAPPPGYVLDGVLFEGEIDMTGWSLRKGATITMQVFLKKNLVAMRRTYPSPTGSVTLQQIARPDDDYFTTVNDKDRTYQRSGKPMATPGATTTRTGRVEKIAGVPCEDWHFSSDGTDLDACVASGLGPFALGKDVFAVQAWSSFLAPARLFALRVSLAYDGGVAQQMQVTRVLPKSVSDDVFTWPSSYREVVEVERDEADKAP